jgi:hypothetical protein
MLLGLQPARYVVHPHYEDKLRKLLDVTCDMEGGLPLEYDITPLTVRGCQQLARGAGAAAFSSAPAPLLQGHVLLLVLADTRHMYLTWSDACQWCSGGVGGLHVGAGGTL